MTPFSYRLDAHDGHRFDPPPSEFEVEVRQIILNWAGYSQLPLDVPFVGHFPLPKGAYVILSKPAGQQGYDGWVLSGLQYARHQYSPYGFLAENAPKMGIDRAAGPPLDASGFDHRLSDPAGYLRTAARIFAGFDDAHRLRAHRSVAAPDRDGEDALFVLPRTSRAQPQARPPAATPTPIDELGAVRNEVVKLRGLLETMRSQAQPAAADTAARIANLAQRLTDIEAAVQAAAEATTKLNTQRKDDTAKGARAAEQAATRATALETQVADLANTVHTRLASKGGGRLRWALPVAAVLMAAGGIANTAISTQIMGGQVSQIVAAQLGDADNPNAGTVRRQLHDVQNLAFGLSKRIDIISNTLGDPANKNGVFAQLDDMNRQLAKLSDQLRDPQNFASGLSTRIDIVSNTLGDPTKNSGVFKKLDDLGTLLTQLKNNGRANQLLENLRRRGTLERAVGNTELSDTGTMLARLRALDATNPLGRVGKIEEILGDGWKSDSGTVLEQLSDVKAKAKTAYQFLQDACSVLANVKDVERQILASCQSSFRRTEPEGQEVRP